ncbi:MAG: hypothetical protein L0332_25085 [Chloroflexi bacterium]|nr:hypothetical protein [Chloroflexota bacterium]MCI0575165.1 hypothetical protein [Chloroflexota bacterium]MCI0647153.1 hypothetical protein [Chloroflexota bacterium]MCI0729971.1 hypothetical protein [Chloroflexota bacterium]
MRTITFLLLLLAFCLAGCAAPGQAADQSGVVPVDRPAAGATTAPVLPAPMLLAQWNATERRQELLAVEPATGQSAADYTPLVVGDNEGYSAPYVFSAGGRRLAVVESHGEACRSYAGGLSCWPSADVLHLVDVPTWQDVAVELPANGWVWSLAFDAQATHLALVYQAREYQVEEGTTLMVFEANTGALVAERPLPFEPSLMAYTGDGASLALFGAPPGEEPGISPPGTTRLLLVNAATLETTWDQPFANLANGWWCLESCDAPHGEQLFVHWAPAVVPSPDGRKLYIVHADEEMLTTIDLDAQQMNTVGLQVAQSWFEKFLALTAGVAEAKGGLNGAVKSAVLSPDGQKLYVVGRTMNSTRDDETMWELAEESLGLQVIDVATGRIEASYASEALFIGITPDGTRLLLKGWGEAGPWAEVVDTASLERVAYLTNWEVGVTWDMDGQTVIVASQPTGRRTQLAIIESERFTTVHSWFVESYASWLTRP